MARSNFMALKKGKGDKQRLVKVKECEQVEARLLIAHENLNIVEVEKKRMEQILMVLLKNPANNPDFTSQLDDTSTNIRKLIGYELQVTKVAEQKTE